MRALTTHYSLLTDQGTSPSSPPSGFLPQVKPLRMLRVLRPLRLLAQHGGMRVILSSLVDSLPAVSNVFGVVLFFMLSVTAPRLEPV